MMQHNTCAQDGTRLQEEGPTANVMRSCQFELYPVLALPTHGQRAPLFSAARLHHASAQRHVPKMQRESRLHGRSRLSAPPRRDSMCHCVLSQDLVTGMKAWCLPFGSPPP